MNTLTFTVPNVREPQYRDSRTGTRVTPEAYNILESISARTGLTLSFIASQMIIFASENMKIVQAGKEEENNG